MDGPTDGRTNKGDYYKPRQVNLGSKIKFLFYLAYEFTELVLLETLRTNRIRYEILATLGFFVRSSVFLTFFFFIKNA